MVGGGASATSTVGAGGSSRPPVRNLKHASPQLVPAAVPGDLPDDAGRGLSETPRPLQLQRPDDGLRQQRDHIGQRADGVAEGMFAHGGAATDRATNTMTETRREPATGTLRTEVTPPAPDFPNRAPARRRSGTIVVAFRQMEGHLDGPN